MPEVVTWSRDQAVAVGDRLVVDELDGCTLLVIDDADAANDDGLAWCRSAPCVVAGRSRSGRVSSWVDVVASTDHDVSRLAEVIEANPQAARTLVDVLRVVERVDIPSGLTVESLAYSLLLGGEEFRRWRAAQPPRLVRSHDGPPLLVHRDGDRLQLTLNRPENRNAFSAAMRDALVEALTAAEVDESLRAVTIDGAGAVFCSGGDLTEFGTAADLVRAHQIRSLRSIGAVLHRLVGRLGARLVVEVHGQCVGAGVELPAFAGTVHAAATATFRLPEVGMGLIPGAGGTVSLTHRIGRQATAALALLGDEIGAREALRLGLVDAVS